MAHSSLAVLLPLHMCTSWGSSGAAKIYLYIMCNFKPRTGLQSLHLRSIFSKQVALMLVSLCHCTEVAKQIAGMH